MCVVQIRQSALKHGVTVDAINHAVEYALFADEDLEEGSDPPKMLILGPDTAANLIEVIGTANADGELIVFHAMAARTAYRRLLDNE
jgi:hypothetical protein